MNPDLYQFQDNSFRSSGTYGLSYMALFLVWPFLSFLTALANYGSKETRKVVYMFLLYYGFFFVSRNEQMDAFRYSLGLAENAQRPFSDVFNIIRGLYSDTTVDIVEPVISFIVSRFTVNPGFYFVIWVGLMGYFYLRFLNIVHNSYSSSRNWNTLFFMVVLIFLIPITEVSGIRMPTASWIFFFAAYHVVLYRDARYLILALSSSLVH